MLPHGRSSNLEAQRAKGFYCQRHDRGLPRRVHRTSTSTIDRRIISSRLHQHRRWSPTRQPCPRLLGQPVPTSIFQRKGIQPQCSILPQLDTAYHRHEAMKRRAYEQRVREIEHGSFTPLVFTTSGGMGKSAMTTYKRLASLLAEKREQEYSTTMTWLRCHLSFSLLRSAITCLRGARSSYRHAAKGQIVPDLAVSEGHLTE